MKRVYVHGLGQTPGSWEKTISCINHEEPVICPDLAALVRSDGADYGRLYGAFSALCNKLDGVIGLCGLSLGSVLALHYAIDYPDKVRSLALIAPQYKMPKRLLQVQNSIFHLLPGSAFGSTGFQKSDFIQLCRSMMDLDFSRSLDKVSCPVLVVYGEKDRANKKAAIELSRNLRNGALKEVGGAGHEVNIDAPEKLSELLSAFYDRTA